jgi:23S rRNA pseudouridine1911/1915/1917 synthase
MDVKIIFEDESLLVVDKPWGITVNNAETTKNQETIQDWLNSKFQIPNSQTEFYEKSGIVHRLDKDTSGVLVIAKTPESYSKLKLPFQNRETIKKYYALVHGAVEPPSGTVNVPIGRNPFNRTRFGVFPGGREAETIYKAIQICRHTGMQFTLLEVQPKTGRTHQIRVHMKYINHPIVSDPIYGGRKQIREDLKFCPRLFLHAASLTILGKTYESPLPADLQNVLNLFHGE